MFLLVGLGNPGLQYENTRHNIGFRAVDEFRKGNNFPDFEFEKRFNAEISRGEITCQKITLAKPQTFMNNSGSAVKKLILNLKSEILNLIVVHDDIDLPLGQIKIVQNRGSAGHKGVQSIINALKTKDFARIRIGINSNSKLKTQSSKPQLKTQKLEKFVLKKFVKDEEKILEDVIKKAAEAVKMIIEEGVEKAMNEYNG